MIPTRIRNVGLKDLGIVIPAYKAEKLIGRTISSALDEGIPRENIIVVEDGHFDNTPAVVDKFEGVRLVRKARNEGAPRARNEGLNLVDTPYVMFLDSDDYVEGGILASLVEEIARKEADVAFGPWRFDGENRPPGRIRHPPDIPAQKWIFYWLHSSCVPTCALIWNTKSVRSIGAWDERLNKNQDGELAVRAFISGFKVAISSDGCGVYWQHNAASRVSDASVKDRLNSSEILYSRIASWISGRAGQNEENSEYLLGKYCCKVAWAAAEGGSYAEMRSWFRRAERHGYALKYYSRATSMARWIGVPFGAKLKSALRLKVKRILQD